MKYKNKNEYKNEREKKYLGKTKQKIKKNE